MESGKKRDTEFLSRVLYASKFIQITFALWCMMLCMMSRHQPNYWDRHYDFLWTFWPVNWKKTQYLMCVYVCERYRKTQRNQIMVVSNLWPLKKTMVFHNGQRQRHTHITTNTETVIGFTFTPNRSICFNIEFFVCVENASLGWNIKEVTKVFCINVDTTFIKFISFLLCVCLVFSSNIMTL